MPIRSTSANLLPTAASPPIYDLFISYAHRDNVPLIEGAKGWVLEFASLLEKHLNRRGLRDPVQIWFDGWHVQGNHELQTSIPSAVARSSLFLAVISPSYVLSSWCKKERDAFVRAHGKDLKERIFNVHLAPLEPPSQVPDELRGLAKQNFYDRDDYKVARTFGSPAPRFLENEYFNAVEMVAIQIGSKLKQLAAAAAPALPTAAPIPKLPGQIDLGNRHVWLAEVSEEAQPRRDEVVRYLDQAGIRVAPVAPYPTESAAFEAALAEDLRGAALFVQNLTEVDHGSRALRQYLAAKQAGLPILQWRSPDLRPETIEDDIHRALVERPTVQAGPIEDFKRAILDALRPAPAPAVTSKAPMLLINVDPVDRDRAIDFVEALGEGIEAEVWSPKPNHGQEANEAELLALTLGSAGVVVFQGDVDSDWVRRQMKQVHKFVPPCATPARLKWVVCQPHPPRERLGLKLEGWKTRSYDEALRLLPGELA